MSIELINQNQKVFRSFYDHIADLKKRLALVEQQRDEAMTWLKDLHDQGKC